MIGQGCMKCLAHFTCPDAFQEHSHNCNHYDKTEKEFIEWIEKMRKEKEDET